jgi:hypothetical protein
MSLCYFIYDVCITYMCLISNEKHKHVEWTTRILKKRQFFVSYVFAYVNFLHFGQLKMRFLNFVPFV